MRTLVGLDIETTGLDFARHKIIQVGVATRSGATFSADIGWTQGYEFEDEALAVNGFTHERIRAGKPVYVVDDELHDWLITNGAAADHFVPVGWNVGSFDMPFVRKFLPRSASLFSYRSVDLNSIVFGIWMARYAGLDTLKKRAKQYAETTLCGKWETPQWHDALYDAAASLLALEYLVQQIGGDKCTAS